MPTRLIIGCGYLGSRVAARWCRAGDTVFALTRSRAGALTSEGIRPIVGDVLVPDSLAQLPRVDTVLYAVGFDRSAGKSFREVYVEGLRNLMTAIPTPGRFIYISSTSVYGQQGDVEVDESSPTEPLEESGKVILEAEQTLRAAIPESVILRFAGIYGPNRMLRRLSDLQAGVPFTGNPHRRLNLIHVDDGATVVVVAAEQRATLGTTYLVADNAPPTRIEFYTELARLFHAPTPQFDPVTPPDREGNRKISNRRIRKDLGVELNYPNYRAGLAQIASLTPS